VITAAINISVNVKKPTQSVGSTTGGRSVKGCGHIAGRNKPIAPITAIKATTSTRKNPTFFNQAMRLLQAFHGTQNNRATMITVGGRIRSK